jgi:mycothiol synthase
VGRGLSAWLLRLAEERARDKVDLAPRSEPVVLQAGRIVDNDPARRLFEALGYAYARTFWMMRIELGTPPPPPRLPAGIAIRGFEPGTDDARAYAALSEAFADHWGQGFPTFDQWRHFCIQGAGTGFDPGMWFLAVEGDEVVGVASCKPTSPRAAGTALVDDLAVRRPWRKQGIGLALLHAAFGEFHRRGIPRAELGVDLENPTGATRPVRAGGDAGRVRVGVLAEGASRRVNAKTREARNLGWESGYEGICVHGARPLQGHG